MTNSGPLEPFLLSLSVLWQYSKGETAIKKAFAVREMGIILGTSLLLNRSVVERSDLTLGLVDALTTVQTSLDQEKVKMAIEKLNRYLRAYDYEFPKIIVEGNGDKYDPDRSTLLDTAKSIILSYLTPENIRHLEVNIPLDIYDGLIRTWMQEQRTSINHYRDRMLESARGLEGDVMLMEGTKLRISSSTR